MNQNEERVWRALAEHNLHPEELSAQLQLTLAEVHASLLALELESCVEADGASWRRTR